MLRRLLTGALLLLPTAGGAAPVAPDARGAVVPDRSFDMTALRLDLALLPDQRAVEGTATWTVRRLGPGPLVLDQVELEGIEVTLDGRALTWRRQGDTLEIEVPGDGGAVQVRYRATPRSGLHWRAPGPDSPDTYAEVWSQGEAEENRYWFPSYDHPNDRFVYEGHFTAPPGWKVLTNAPGTDLVNYLVMVAAGPYEVHRDAASEVWVPPGTPEADWRPALDPIGPMMEHFRVRTGVPWPWGPYRQVFVQRFLYSGMENTTATVEADRLLAPPGTRATRPRNEQVFAHELAHQWYGDLLTCRDWRELWLNEGFATFFEGDWTASRQGPERAAAIRRGWMRASLGDGSLAGRYWRGPDTPRHHNVYAKGASVLTMLRVLLGEDTFWAGIRAYTTTHSLDLVHTRDLQVAMEDASGLSLDWFFQQWVELPYVPSLSARWRMEGTDLVLDLEQLDLGERPVYTLPLDLEIGGQAGAEQRRVWMEGPKLSVRLPRTSPPAYVAVDATGGLLANLTVQQDPEAWEAQLASPSPAARLQAIAALGATSRVDPLAQLLQRPGPLAIREAAAAALGEQRSTAPLLSALADPDPLIRLAAARALVPAARAGDAAALTRLLRAEGSVDVRASLLEALAGAAPPEAAAVARRVLAGRADDAEVSVAARVLGDAGKLTDLPLLLQAPARRDRRLGGLRAAARVAQRLPESTERTEALARVARSAELLLQDLDLRGREGGVAVLGEVGERRSEPVLEQFVREEEVRELQEAARRALTAIRGRATAPSPAPNEVDARLRDMAARLDALEQAATRAEERH